MDPCTIDSWDMNLDDASGNQVARPLFRNIQIVNGVIISGEVQLQPGHIVSQLRGFCVPFPDLGIPEVSMLTFLFRLKNISAQVGIFLTGLGFNETGSTKASFEGKWIAHRPGPHTPASGELVTFALPGSGDTGSGSGTQT